MPQSAAQSNQLLQSIQQEIAKLNSRSKEFFQLVFADFYLKAEEDCVETAEAAIALLERDVIPFVKQELWDSMQFQVGSRETEILEAVKNYLRQEPQTVEAVKQTESISDALADELEKKQKQ